MKKLHSIIILLIILLIPAVGCSNNANSACTKANIDMVNKRVKTFLNKCNDKNGIYLYDDGKGDMYLYLNNYYVLQGEKASYISDVKTEGQGKTLVIKLYEKYTDDYKSKNVGKRLLYRVKMAKGFDTISVNKNGKETSFDMIGN